MKRILLTSTALVAFAGAAAADITWSGDAKIGYNDDVEGGFFYEAGLTIKGSKELNNGIEAGFFFDVDIDFEDNNSAGNDDGAWDGIDFDASDYHLYMKTDTAALYFGDTKTATDRIWNGTTNLETDGFLEKDDVDDGAKKGDYVNAILRGDLMYNGVDASLSYFLYENNAGDQDLGGLQVAAKGNFGAYNFGIAYQAEDEDVIVDNNPINQIVGLWIGGSFSGADVKLAYSQETDVKTDNSENSTGIQVSYPFGPVKATAFYSAESAGDDNYGIALGYSNGQAKVDFWYHDGQDQEIGLEGSYDVGNGLKLYAGFIQNDDDSDATEAYIAGEYDLGGGAELLLSYGDAGDNYTGENDEIGDKFEVNEGTTIQVKFKF